MSTDAHHPTSRITDALLPPPAPRSEAAAPAGPRAASAPAPSDASPEGGQDRPTAAAPGRDTKPAAPPPPAGRPGGKTAARPSVAPPRPPASPPAQAPHARPPHGVPPRPPEAPRTPPEAPRMPVATPAPAAPAAPAPRTPVATPAPAAHAAPAPRTANVRPPHGSDVPAVETTTRLRPIRGTEPARPPAPRPPAPRPATPRPAAAPGPLPPARPPADHGAYRPYTVPPETPAETTTRLRPVRERRTGRLVAAGACLVLGLGLIGGAVAGAVLAATDAGEPAQPPGYEEARTLWHDVPVDTLFPRTLAGPGTGPGAADRTWTRIVVAPDAPCSAAVLQKSLLTAVRTVGCARVLRATYTDATASSVVTVGLVFTQADPEATRSLAGEGAARIATDVPPALAAPGTVAARFGAAQRASWFTRPLTDLPVVVTSVAGFADGRPVDRPEPAARAMAAGQTSAPAQAGLGHEAKGVADRIERGLRTAVTAAAKDGDV